MVVKRRHRKHFVKNETPKVPPPRSVFRKSGIFFKTLMKTYGLSKYLVTLLTHFFEVSKVIVFHKGSRAKKALQHKGFALQKRTISRSRMAC